MCYVERLLGIEKEEARKERSKPSWGLFFPSLSLSLLGSDATRCTQMRYNAKNRNTPKTDLSFSPCASIKARAALVGAAKLGIADKIK